MVLRMQVMSQNILVFIHKNIQCWLLIHSFHFSFGTRFNLVMVLRRTCFYFLFVSEDYGETADNTCRAMPSYD